MSAPCSHRLGVFVRSFSAALLAMLTLLLMSVLPARADGRMPIPPGSPGGGEGGSVRLLTSIPFATSGFDISWVEQTTGRYFLADSGNNAVDWFDASTTDPNSFLVRQLAKGAFAGPSPASCTQPRECGGPNGVVTDNLHRVWAGDAPTNNDPQSSVKVIETSAPYSYQTVNTGGRFRSDELSFDPRDHMILIANPADGFLTWINTDTLSVVGKFYYAGNADGQPATVAGHVADQGLEQSVYVPSTGLFYQAVPGHGIDVFQPNPVDSVGRLVATFATPSCSGGPTGLTLAAHQDLVGACGNGGVVVDARTGRNDTLIPNVGGADEIWFNRSDGNVYFAILTVNPGPPLTLPGTLGVANGIRDTFVTTQPSGMAAHSVAAYEANDHVFVPTTDHGIEIFTTRGPGGPEGPGGPRGPGGPEGPEGPGAPGR